MVSCFASVTEQQILSTDYSTCVIHTKTVIYISVGESGGYLPPHR